MKFIALTTWLAGILLFGSCVSSSNYNYREVVAEQWDSNNYERQRHALGMASLKGFRGNVYYIGSDENFHFFKVDKYAGFFRVVKSGIKLGEVFPVGGKAYLVDVPHQ